MSFSYFDPTAPQQPYQVFAVDNNVNDTAAMAQTSLDYYTYHHPAAAFYSADQTITATTTRPPSQQILRQHSPPNSFWRHNSLEMGHPDPLGQYIVSEYLEDPLAMAQRSTRSSSEEKDAITPAQSRRKAQNRAAQRAFRERKERRVKELEQKLNDLQAQSMVLHADNERLKRELARVAIENEILRATSGGDGLDEGGQSQQGSRNGSSQLRNPDQETDQAATINGPKKWISIDVRKKYAADYKSGSLPHRIILSAETGERLLDTRATWDLIQSHPSFQRGLVDIGDVFERLKLSAKCDGQGPAFEEGKVRQIIEESVASGNDELI